MRISDRLHPFTLAKTATPLTQLAHVVRSRGHHFVRFPPYQPQRQLPVLRRLGSAPAEFENLQREIVLSLDRAEQREKRRCLWWLAERVWRCLRG